MKKFYKAIETMVKDKEFSKIKNVIGTSSEDMYYVGSVEDIEHDQKLCEYYVGNNIKGYKIPLMASLKSVGVLKSLIYYLEHTGYFYEE